MKKELRFFVAQELRAAGSEKQPKIEGVAASFGTVANIGSFKEVIKKGAFTRTLASDTDVVCLFNHDDNLLLGRKSAGTLRVWEDEEVGLRFECDLPDTTVARHTYANLKAGNLRECSFGFYVNGPEGESWSTLPDGTMLRTLLDVTLFDVSVVVNPAYGGTSALARNVVPDDLEARMASATRAATEASGEPVPFVNLGKDKRSEDPFNSVDEANGIINWADGEDEDRAADAPVRNKLKASQGFAYVANNGENRSDYLLPHHQVRSGELVHSQIGALRAMMSFKTKAVDIPAEHRNAVESHLQQELSYWFPADNDENDSELERSKARARIAEARAL